MANKEEKSKILPIAAAGTAAAIPAYVLTRKINISDPKDLDQQRLIKAYKSKGYGVGFPTGQKNRALLAKGIFDPYAKYYTSRHELYKDAPGVLFSKSKGGFAGGITINGPYHRKHVKHLVKNKEVFDQLPHIGKYFGKAEKLDNVLKNEYGISDKTTLSDKQFKDILIDIEKKHGKYFYKPLKSHSLIGAYGSSEDIPKQVKRVDINLWNRLLNKSVKKIHDPELIKKIKEQKDTIIQPDFSGKGQEYRLEIINKQPTLLHRFGMKKGLKVNRNKLTPEANKAIDDFSKDYTKFLHSKGGYARAKEIPFAGADIFLTNKNKLHGVELQFNSGFPFHAKQWYHMLTKPYASTWRMQEYITGHPSHLKGMGAGVAAAALAAGTTAAILKNKNNTKVESNE